MDIYKIVLTGGPCAGKTTVINQIRKELSKDYYIVTIPETATELINSGILPDNNKEHTLKFQEIVLFSQMLKECNALEYLESLKQNNIDFIKQKKGMIILYDRGIMDNRAYLSHQDYNDLLAHNELNELEVMDRYDLVIDLISTATTKPEVYGLNGVRYETIEEAAYKDELTSGAWLLHRNLEVVKPTETIKEKIEIVLKHIYDLLNGIYQKEMLEFEVDEENTDFSYFNINNSRIMNLKTFTLKTYSGLDLIVEKRMYNGNISFILKRIDLSSDVPKILESFPIDYDTYSEILTTSFLKDIKEVGILKFIHKGNVFTLIKDSESLKLVTTPDNINEIPNNIVLKKQKIFTK